MIEPDPSLDLVDKLAPSDRPLVGSDIDCRIQTTHLDVAALRTSLPKRTDCGGYVAFEGLVRSVNLGLEVTHLDYEAYEALALKEMRRICERAAETFGAPWIRLVHRTGRLVPGDVAVSVQVLAPHRAEAFDACRMVIDQLKIQVPIWKKESYADGSSEWTRCHEHPPTLAMGMTGLG